jgi:hypothetical protein
MVKSAINMQEKATNGLKLLLKDIKGSSQTQAVWRFLNNPVVTIKELFEPIEKTLEVEIEKQCDEYILAISDWSHLDYKKHTRKKELKIENKKNNCKKIGYDLQTTIAVSDKTGEPIAPLVHNLKTSEKVYSTYNDNIDMKLTHLEELALRTKSIDDSLKTKKKIVNIIDREADSIAFMRLLEEFKQFFLLRVKKTSKVNYYDKKNNKIIEIKQSDLANKLSLGKKVKRIRYKNKNVNIHVNECDITISRDATKMVIDKDGKKTLQRTPGKTLNLRFIVERLVDVETNEVVAEWLLVTNVLDKNVTATTLATWYYYRWKIESYFKLLKSSGFNLEEWQQIEPLALFKRLIIISNACMMVWRIANTNTDNAKKIRDFLIKLSGKQLEYRVEFTYPALMTGLENYLTFMDLLARHSIDDLFKMKEELIDIIGLNI